MMALCKQIIIKPGFLAGCIFLNLCLLSNTFAAILEEVIVTATKREVSSQDVPISITTFSGEQIRNLSLNTNYDLMNHVPGLQLKPQFSISSPDIVLRGVGSQSFFANTISPVGFYADGIYIGQSIAQGFQLFDLERVEVLRGPQGTLFGRNTTGGLLNVISRKPEVADGTNGRVELTFGEFGMFNVEAAAGAPISDNAAVRFALLRQSSDGAFDNVNPAVSGDDGEIDLTSVRGSLHWEPSDSVDVLLNFHFSNNGSDIRPFKPSFPAAFVLAGQVNAFTALLPNNLLPPPAGNGLANNCPPGAPTSGIFQSGCSIQFSSQPVLTDTPGFHDTQISFDSFEDVETYGFYAEINWTLGDYTLTSVTGWDTADAFRLSDIDGHVLVLGHQTDFADTDFWSQEIRIASNYDGAFNWIAGASYYSDEVTSQFFFNQRDHGPARGGLLAPLPLPVGIGQNVTQESDSWAVFGESSYDFTEQWKLTLGLRLTNDERTGDVDTFLFNALAVPTDAILPNQAAAATLFPILAPALPELESDWFEWNGRAVLDYRFDEEQMVYASASRGFRGGEFNGGALFSPIEVRITDPEFVNSYEIGYKGALLDNTLQLNLTGFYMELEDQQIQIFATAGLGVLPTLLNAGASEIKGFEWELQWQPDDHWYVLFAGAYMDAEFTEFLDPVEGVNRAGNELPDSPEWTFNGIVRYEQPLGNGMLALQADWLWEAERFLEPTNNPNGFKDSFGLINVRADYKFMENWTASLFVKNLLDEEYLLASFDATGAAAAVINIPADPRVFGGSIKYEF